MSEKKGLKYTKSHEWLEDIGGGAVRVGLSSFAQSELGDIVFVNLPEVGDKVTAGAAFADVESVKAVSDIFSPVTGTVREINEELLDAPELINEDCFGAWLAVIEDVSESEELMEAEEYEAFAAAQKEKE